MPSAGFEPTIPASKTYALYRTAVQHQFVLKYSGDRMKEYMWVGRMALTGRRDMYTEFWWGNLKEGGRREDLGVDLRINIKMDFK
jgi:hypothetical protein